jgi:hypothetical protein
MPVASLSHRAAHTFGRTFSDLSPGAGSYPRTARPKIRYARPAMPPRQRRSRHTATYLGTRSASTIDSLTPVAHVRVYAAIAGQGGLRPAEPRKIICLNSAGGLPLYTAAHSAAPARRCPACSVGKLHPRRSARFAYVIARQIVLHHHQLHNRRLRLGPRPVQPIVRREAPRVQAFTQPVQVAEVGTSAGCIVLACSLDSWLLCIAVGLHGRDHATIGQCSGNGNRAADG